MLHSTTTLYITLTCPSINMTDEYPENISHTYVYRLMFNILGLCDWTSAAAECNSICMYVWTETEA